ncbi:MAG: nucleotidyltransferase domain-containing protein [Oscillospiraceae bacterium]|nr:nucleotidyltransferase domain-containing protein [Oscillospiraceae bacterium]
MSRFPFWERPRENKTAAFAAEHKIHIWLCGSFQKGSASPYSDVDICVACNAGQIKQLL